MSKKLPEIKIKIDSREKTPWVFNEEEKQPGKIRIVGSVVDTIDAADYTIIGLENIIRIERKVGFRELFGNYSPKENKERFEREMEKLKDIPHKYLLIENQLSDDILSLSIPQYSMGPTANKILEWLMYLSHTYGIMPIFVGECGQRTAKTIFKSIARRYLYDN